MFDVAKRRHVATAFFRNIRIVHMTLFDESIEPKIFLCCACSLKCYQGHWGLGLMVNVCCGVLLLC